MLLLDTMSHVTLSYTNSGTRGIPQMPLFDSYPKFDTRCIVSSSLAQTPALPPHLQGMTRVCGGSMLGGGGV